MAQPYLENLQSIVRVLDAANVELVCKHFFSGAALYADGSICASLSPRGLAFKLARSRCDELVVNKSAQPLQYIDGGPIKKDYVVFPNYAALSDGILAAYFNECIDHCRK
jgi:hypothetical protein